MVINLDRFSHLVMVAHHGDGHSTCYSEWWDDLMNRVFMMRFFWSWMLKEVFF